MLIILDGDGKLITSSGRAVVSGDKEGKVGNFEVLLVYSHMRRYGTGGGQTFNPPPRKHAAPYS